jgi:uncharacterized integral membrane protein (TIGR00698 family)
LDQCFAKAEGVAMFSLTRFEAPSFPRLVRLAPGVALCAGVSLVAGALAQGERTLFGHVWLEALVLAILAGAAVRTVWRPGPQWEAGLEFSAKTVLEFAVVLLGLTVDPRALVAAGPWLLLGVLALVALTIASSYGLGRLFGLPRKLAILIACGNAICGNSAIAAVAPVIGAEGEDVGAAIAFTAVLGVALVLGLPALAAALQLSPRSFGVFAGLTVYAVPQVLAATAPVSPLSTQVGALVKLVRVLTLSPVVAVLSLLGFDEGRPAPTSRTANAPGQGGRRLGNLAPWFILGFLALAGLRATVPLPPALIARSSSAASALTIVSMAALGLGVDVRALLRAGPRVSLVVVLSIGVLGGLAFTLVRLLALR